MFNLIQLISEEGSDSEPNPRRERARRILTQLMEETSDSDDEQEEEGERQGGAQRCTTS